MKRIILSAAIFFLLSPYAFVMAAPASQWIPCNDPNVKYFTCIDTNRACFQYDANVTKNPDFVAGGATTPESTCTIINMQLLSCSSGQGTPSECASWQKAIAAEQATAGGCCVRKSATGKVSDCMDIKTGPQKLICDTRNLRSDLLKWTTVGMFSDTIESTAAGCATVEGCPQFTPAPAVAGATNPLKDLVIKQPLLNITIPGLSLTDVNKVDAEGYLYIPWIAEYMTALYKFAIGVVSIVAMVMIIYHGARIATSAGGSGKIDGYKGIFRAIVGLLIAWGSYAILYNVNPNLVQFNALKIQYVKSDPLPDISTINEDVTIDTGSGSSAASIVGLLGGALPSSYQPCSQDAAMYAAQKLVAMSICVGPCHCAWTASEFLKYIGCNIVHGDSPNQIKSRNPSWVEETISASQWQKYPYVGVLITSGRGHAGVYLGNGWVFQSVEFSDGDNFSKAQNCPNPSWKVRTEDDKPKPENFCSSCAKLKGHEPWSGYYESANVVVGNATQPNPGGKNGGTACVRSQRWRMDQKSDNGGWGYLLHPPS